mmetsp:Transcript_31188/g.56762  ORF Transcript_31188/g.56762 Transcript_31188/m.56762 type:complete len:336 (+) Transcript_31188:679-1686(+)
MLRSTLLALCLFHGASADCEPGWISIGDKCYSSPEKTSEKLTGLSGMPPGVDDYCQNKLADSTLMTKEEAHEYLASPKGGSICDSRGICDGGTCDGGVCSHVYLHFGYTSTRDDGGNGNRIWFTNHGWFAPNPWETNRWFSCVSASAPAPAPSTNGACFHGDGTVLLESGVLKRLSELGLGDVIKTSDGQGRFLFNPVLALPHANNSEPAAFLTLTTETDKKVDMTSDHIIPKCDQQEVAADELVVGDCLITADGKEVLMEISSTAKAGVFTAITQDNFIVVNGIVASPFSKDSDPAKPELDYNKYRLELEEKYERKLSYHASKHQKRVRRAYAN